MNSPLTVNDLRSTSFESPNSSAVSGVSWGAVFAGAAGAASLSLVLFVLGTGLGLTSTSPWRGDGVSATTLGLSGLLWLTFTQVVASVVGGYLAGRLRVKWVNVHNDEVYFRDTAHGFIAWSVATLAMVLMVATLAAATVSGGVRAASTVAGGAMAAGGVAIASGQGMPGMSGPPTLSYSIDSLFRVDPKVRPEPQKDTVEITRIFAADLLVGELPAEDKTYVAQVIAARTGSTQADAEQRVDTLFTNLKNTEVSAKQKAKEAADAARKAIAYAALWLVISLLAGAFSASVAATFGGKLRDKIA